MSHQLDVGGSAQAKEATTPHIFQWDLSREKENDQPAKGTRYRAPGRDSKAIVLEERQEVTEGDRA